MSPLANKIRLLLGEAKRVGVLTEEARVRIAAQLSAGDDDGALRTVEALVDGAPRVGGAGRDPLRPWRWPEGEYDEWFGRQRWFASRWGVVGGMVVVTVLDETAMKEARARWPGYPILTIATVQELAAKPPTPEMLKAILTTLAKFPGDAEADRSAN